MRRAKTKREKERIGKELRVMRERAGMSPELMADRLEVALKTIENYEAGRVQQPKSVLISYEVVTNLELSGLVKAVSPCNYAEQQQLFFVDETLIAA